MEIRTAAVGETCLRRAIFAEIATEESKIKDWQRWRGCKSFDKKLKIGTEDAKTFNNEKWKPVVEIMF